MKIWTALFNEFVTHCHTQSLDRGWWLDPSHTKDLAAGVRQISPSWEYTAYVGLRLAQIMGEVGEGLEAYRKDKQDDHLPHRKGLEVELADAVIRIADLAGALGLDLGGAITEKLEYNLQRADHNLAVRAQVGGKRF